MHRPLSRAAGALALATALAACASARTSSTTTTVGTPTSAVPMPQTTAPAYVSNARGLDARNRDESAGACVDFYQFANGGWLARNEIPADRTAWSLGSELSVRNDSLLQRILEKAARERGPQGSIAQKVGDVYASALDTVRIDALGIAPVRADLDRIAALRSTSEIPALVAGYHAEGATFLFQPFVEADFQNTDLNILYIVQGGLGLPEKDYYLREGAEAEKLRTQYVDHIAKMLTLAGDDSATAARRAARVLEMETRLARASLGAVELRNPANLYRPTTVAEANVVTPRFDWSAYLRTVGAQATTFSFPHRGFFSVVDTMLAQYPIDDWKSYLRWHVLNETASLLASPFEKESFRFFGTVLQGVPQQQPRWRRARGVVSGTVGEGLGQLFVAEAFPPEAKARAEAMVANIRAALGERLAKLDWMSDSTRAKALAKLATFTVKIGYPDEWRDYSALDIRAGDHFGNVRRASAFEARRNFAKVGKPVDRGEWGMTPQTINAYYNPLRNEIVFPAAILQPPFFDPTADDALNYGAIGAVIGHEIMHGFDDQGSQFDAQGRFSNWWTEADRKEFERRAQVLVDQYAGYTAVDTLRVNGKLTLGENIGDLGGLIIAYHGLQRALGSGPRQTIDGLTPDQRFFLSFAQAWRAKQRPEALKVQVLTDPHSPSRFRAMGPVSNMPEFAAAFGCKPGDPMVRSNPVRIW